MKYKNYIDAHIHEGKVTSSHLQCLGSFSSVLALLRPTPKTCTRTAQRVILPPHHRDSSFRLPSFFVLDLRPSSSIPFFFVSSSSSTNSPFLEPASPDVVQSGLLFFVLFSSLQPPIIDLLFFFLFFRSLPLLQQNPHLLLLSLHKHYNKKMANIVRDLFLTELKNLFSLFL